MEAANAELLSQISASSNDKMLWAYETATLTGVAGKPFPGDSKNRFGR